MTVRKFRLFIAPNIDKEEQWITEMSRKGLHLVKYEYFTYVFEEDPTKSYVYQIDFRQEAKRDYFQLYEDAGWEYVTNSMSIFHYFRADSSEASVQKLYTDNESIQDSFKRMISFYLLIFGLFLVSQLGLVVSWKGYLIQYIVAGMDIVFIVLYLYLFYAINKRIDFYRRK
ncbi:DUF2812 domain-containing protein [Ornithinibacillus scapharcae]|uniref:DUF2812 domain-containing protein n=1 Tax=Ornithinibacillus scapharcae TaxID=1147159 RepID=UPI000225AB7D|nr:DUF2812 domain-containing protein [Ornithinibacillus scapharcae]